VVVTNQRPSARPEDDENFAFVTTGIADAVARAREIASDKDVGINGARSPASASARG
jgi:dihydrofolate reductase